MNRDLVRTTSFRLKPEHFGYVHLYRAGRRFQAVWQRLEDAYSRGDQRDQRKLPYKGFVTALRVYSADFVRMFVDRGQITIASRQPLDVDVLQSAFNAWEYAVWPQLAKGALSDVVDDLQGTHVSVWDSVQVRPRACANADTWVWEVAGWEIAHRLASAALVLDGGITATLRLDTNGNLLTWDRPVTAPSARLGPAFALHRIKPKLVTIPGLSAPALNFEGSLTRLSVLWGFVKRAWIDRGPDRSLLAVDVKRRKVGDDWQSYFADASTEVLRRMDLNEIADPQHIDLQSSKVVRGRLSQARTGFPIGTGPGQMFHEAIALHVHRCVPDLEPVELCKARRSLPSPNQGALASADVKAAARHVRGKELRIVALYAGDDTRKRMLDAVRPVFPSLPRRVLDGEIYEDGPLEITFCSPRGAELLIQNGDATAIRDWIGGVARRWTNDKIMTAALIETTPEDDRSAEGDDPKFVIRDALANMGIVSQFMSSSSAPKPKRGSSEPLKDHAAERALWDLLRGAGAFPRPFPNVSAVPDGTLLVGLHVVQRRLSGPNSFNKGFVISLVAAEAGGRDARALAPDGKWYPLGRATAAFHATGHDFERERVVSWIDGGLSSLLNQFPSRSAIIFADAIGCRRFFTALKDTGGDGVPSIVRGGRAALVRVRSSEVPRPAGIGEWPDDDLPGKPHTQNALLKHAHEDWDGAHYYINTPRNMSVQGMHRTNTRFSAAEEDPASLRDNWQALNLTEFLCIRSGPFESETLYDLAALLCREAPTWDGTLDLPSPCHLAKAMVEDHPGQYVQHDDAPPPRRRIPLDAPAQQVTR